MPPVSANECTTKTLTRWNSWRKAVLISHLDYFFFFFFLSPYRRWNFYYFSFNLILGITILTDAKDVISDAFTDVTSPLIKRLHERLEYANRSEVHRRLFEVRDAGYLHRIATLPLKYDEYQRKTLHVVKECPKDYIIANVMKKGNKIIRNSILFNDSIVLYLQINTTNLFLFLH